MGTFNNVNEHEKICKELNALYSAKNHDYGDSFRKTRSIVPSAILVRLHDKLGRLDSLLMAPESAKVKDENIDDTLIDLANYAIMELVERRRDACHTCPEKEIVEKVKSLRAAGWSLEDIANEIGYKSDKP